MLKKFMEIIKLILHFRNIGKVFMKLTINLE